MSLREALRTMLTRGATPAEIEAELEAIPELTAAERKADEKRAYWLAKGKKDTKKPNIGATMVCGKCMDFAAKQPDPRARNVAVLAAARGPWEKLPVKTADGQTAYKHTGCPWQ